MTPASWIARRGRAGLPLVPSTASMSRLSPTWRLRLRRLPLIMRAGTLSLLITGFTGGLADPGPVVQSRGLDVLILVDVSQSMRAQDARPDRLGAAIDFARQVIAGRPQDRFGVLLFAGDDALACPLTADHEAVLARLSAIEASPGSGTAIGTAIVGALKRLPEERDQSVLLVFTDGTSNAGPPAPREAAVMARQESARVFTIVIGSTGIAPFPTEAGLINVPVGVDESTMREMAAAGGGLFVRAGDPGAVAAVTAALARVPSVRAKTAAGDASVALRVGLLAAVMLAFEVVVAVLVLVIRS